ncbi:hypothetical protein ACFO5X_02050 [Seohaeicola nanhaiensis]|uniref:Uncharacterized protein n=1 Tax=Seohaeicola nanhaiensis TaxID=1387282 RepID=A0ABV9KB98_9RHOB
MFSLGVLRHAVSMLFYDLWATVRLTLLPVLIGYGLGYFAAIEIGGVGADNLLGDRPVVVDGRIMLGLLAYVLVYFAAFCWAAVAWHRYSLLAERPGGLLPRFDAAQFWAYVGAGFRVGGMGLLMFVPLTIVVGILAPMIGNIWMVMLIMGIPMLLISARLLRYSLVMPAAALGKRMTLAEAAAASEGHTGTFVALTVMLWLIGTLSETDFGGGWAGLILSFLLVWFSLALGLSVLTTLYGVCVEKRDLS